MGDPALQGTLGKRGYRINAKYTNKGNTPKLTSRNATSFLTGKTSYYIFS